jgi:hypothetical protein
MLASPTLPEALADPLLFGLHFRGDSWEPWRVFLTALFGQPLSSGQLALFQRWTGRSLCPNAPFTEAALIVGRRGGKSRVLALVAVYLACFRDYRAHLAPGAVATIAVIAANRAQARSIFRYIAGLLKAVPMLARMIAEEGAEEVVLNNGVCIEITTASFRTTRGYSFAAVLCDEIAFWQSDETSANPDIEILRALRPGLASIPGSMILLASSPYAKRGELWNTYSRHYGKDGARVLVWKAPTEVMNARIDSAVIAEAYDADPEAARAEYGAEFRDDLADFVSPEAVAAVSIAGRYELPPAPGIVYSAFIDPSGGSSDAMALAVGHLSQDGIAVLDYLLEVRAPFDPDQAVAQCAAVLDRYDICVVRGDRYAGEWPKARFKERGILFEQSARSKSDLYADLLPLINAGRVELLDNRRLHAQLIGLERRTSRQGKDSIDHVPGGHDDLANAIAGLLVGLDLDRRPALVRPADYLAGNEGIEWPSIVDIVYAVVMADDTGAAAVCYFAVAEHYGVPLTLLDFDTGFISGNFLGGIVPRLREIEASLRLRFGTMAIWTTEELRGPLAMAGAPCEVIPFPAMQLDELKLTAAGAVAGFGRFKLTRAAVKRGRTSPLGGALDFRPGKELTKDPLRAAAVVGIVLAQPI